MNYLKKDLGNNMELRLWPSDVHKWSGRIYRAEKPLIDFDENEDVDIIIREAIGWADSSNLRGLFDFLRHKTEGEVLQAVKRIERICVAHELVVKN